MPCYSVLWLTKVAAVIPSCVAFGNSGIPTARRTVPAERGAIVFGKSLPDVTPLAPLLSTTLDDDRDLSSSVAERPTPPHEVHWLDPEAEADDSKPLGEAIADGEAVLCIPDVASYDECLDLALAGLAARRVRDGDGEGPARGRSRFSVSDPEAFSNDVVMSCDEILLRVLDHVDDHFLSVYDTLFLPGEGWPEWQPLNARLEQPTVPPPDRLADACDSLRELYTMDELEWSEGEPAINVYEAGGQFGCHKDHMALTVLIPLTSQGDGFSGGGTGFWAGNRAVDEDPGTPPDLVLAPPAGSALVFGGDVTHSGMPVEEGRRVVFVCSFSTRTPASPANRLHGMRAPPEVSPNFKGSV